jgi:monoamine oxidase
VLDDYAYSFGPLPGTRRYFIYFNWNKQVWTGGAVTSYLGVNVWTTSGRIGCRAPVGDIVCAGTDTSEASAGYFDVAIGARTSGPDRAMT